MTSPHPHNYLGEQTLCAIEKAMTEVWTSLQTSDPSVDWLKNGELRSLLANRLLDLAEAGVTDADELSRRTRHILKLYRAKQRLLNRDASVGNCLPTKTIGQSERQVLEKARGAAAASLEAGTRRANIKTSRLNKSTVSGLWAKGSWSFYVPRHCKTDYTSPL
jgi:hypothetical protein